uniref:Uncharacterized protein n=1 Tax=viral metagenome TaxID=1070528 RepID=A0A6H2A1B9_9ZZZZ
MINFILAIWVLSFCFVGALLTHAVVQFTNNILKNENKNRQDTLHHSPTYSPIRPKPMPNKETGFTVRSIR